MTQRWDSRAAQTAKELRSMLGSNAWPIDTKLPKAAELAERFSVSLSVMRLVLAQLIDEGWLKPIVRGYQVAQADVPKPPLADLVRGRAAAGLLAPGEQIGPVFASMWDYPGPELEPALEKLIGEGWLERLPDGSGRIRSALHLALFGRAGLVPCRLGWLLKRAPERRGHAGTYRVLGWTTAIELWIADATPAGDPVDDWHQLPLTDADDPRALANVLGVGYEPVIVELAARPGGPLTAERGRVELVRNPHAERGAPQLRVALLSQTRAPYPLVWCEGELGRGLLGVEVIGGGQDVLLHPTRRDGSPGADPVSVGELKLGHSAAALTELAERVERRVYGAFPPLLRPLFRRREAVDRLLGADRTSE